MAAGGLAARDIFSRQRTEAEAAVVPDARGRYDIVIVAVRRDQLATACAGLTALAARPAIVFFGNNPAGRSAIASDMAGDVYLGFPGVGGVMTGGTAEFVHIRQQPTALQQASDPRLAELESALASCGFAVQRVGDMDGWLAYHAAFIARIAAALYRCGTDPARLAADRATLRLMCQAITGAFAARAVGHDIAAGSQTHPPWRSCLTTDPHIRRNARDDDGDRARSGNIRVANSETSHRRAQRSERPC